MEMNRIVIAGAGTMGASMAQIYAQYFDDVVLYNHRQETLDKAQARIEANVSTLAESGSMSQGQADKVRSAITYTTSMECFRTCDFVAENLAENADIKAAFYQEISQIVPDAAIITTNTSGLPINSLAVHVKDPSRFAGMHWFNPPHLVPLIEIIRNDQTRDDIAQAIYDLTLHIGKRPVLVNKDVPGFAANRIQLAILREALDLVDKGVVSAEGIDDVMKYGLGFRYACLGPLEVTDLGGLDIFYHISEYLMADLCDSHEVPTLLAEHYNAGEYGVKSGKGFYDYAGDKAAQTIAARDEKFLKLYHALYEDGQ